MTISGSGICSSYRLMLKSLDDSLASEDIEMMKFLCRDVVTLSRMEQIRGALDLFLELERCDLLGSGNLGFLAELLYEVHRIDMMKKLDVSPTQLQQLIEKNGGHFINDYRLMLHHLSENMISEDVRQLKYVLSAFGLPRARLEEAKDPYSLFVLLEQQEKLSRENTSNLQELMGQLREAELSNIVAKYNRLHVTDVSISVNVLPTEGAPAALEYPTRSQPRGICLIINNEVFRPHGETPNANKRLNNREGSAIDAGRLQEVFEMLQFRVKTYHDLTSTQILNAVKKIASLSHSHFDLFVCCILTHGEEGVVFGSDCNTVPIHDILAKVKPSRCPSLAEKPKVFFIQACQGEQYEDRSLDSSIPQADNTYFESMDSLQRDGGGIHGVGAVQHPRQPDYLLGLATVPGYVSYRSRSDGTWYVKALCETLRKYHNSQDLLSMLTIVNDQVSRMKKNLPEYTAAQTPLPSSTLRKKLYLRTGTK